MRWGRLLETPSYVLDRTLAGFGVGLRRNAIFLVRDADEVIRNEATLLHQPRELRFAADDGRAARRVVGVGGAAGCGCGRRMTLAFS